MMKKALVLLAVTGAVAASALVLEPTKLMRDVKAGDSHKTKVNVELDFGGQMLTYVATATQKVKEVKADGSLVLEEGTTDTMIIMDGSEQPAGNDAIATVTYDKSGKIKNMESDVMDDTSYRFAYLMAFMWPDKEIDKGSSWDVTLEANDSHSTPKTTFKYSLEGFEDYKGVKTAKVKFDIKEEGDSSTAAGSKGTMWVDVKTGFVKKAEGSMTNLPAAGMVFPTAKFKVETI